MLDDAAADPYGYMRRIYDIWASRFLHDHRLHWVVEQGKRLQIDRLVLEPGRDAAKDPAPLGAADRERLAALLARLMAAHLPPPERA